MFSLFRKSSNTGGAKRNDSVVESQTTPKDTASGKGDPGEGSAQPCHLNKGSLDPRDPKTYFTFPNYSYTSDDRSPEDSSTQDAFMDDKRSETDPQGYTEMIPHQGSHFMGTRSNDNGWSSVPTSPSSPQKRPSVDKKHRSPLQSSPGKPTQ